MMNFIFRVKEALNSRAWEGIFRAIDQQLEVGKTLFHFFNQLACTMARLTTCNAQFGGNFCWCFERYFEDIDWREEKA